MIIKSAEFIVSNKEISKLPKDNKPEYAFIGRSNVGKSSLINMLTGKKKLAKTSGTPGKTRLINHFLINEEWYVVDLPGYGYAQVSKTSRKEFSSFVHEYLLTRSKLMCVFVLIDSRHEPLKNDMEFISWLGENEVPFVLVFTKSDKISANKLEHNVSMYRKILKKYWEELPPVFLSSAIDGTGRDQILDFIANTNRVVYK